ncbi:MAG TPA: glycine zipper 2TM domain-containing protein [Methyloversatilis sp.]
MTLHVLCSFGSRRCRGLVLLVTALLAACATRSDAEPLPVAPAAGAAASQITDIEIHPARGQSEATLRRDRFECHEWAVRESGFDPATSYGTSAPVPHVEPDPPTGTGPVTGAISGAVIGAVVANPHHSGEAAAVGAVIGAAAGAAADASREAQAQRIEEAYAERDVRRQAAEAEQATRYRRALSACLEGRGYTVR